MRNFILALTLLLAAPAWSQAVSPPDRTQTTSLRPTISAELNSQVRGARMWVDGTDFTDHLRTQGNTVSLIPPYNLDYGVHQVRLLTDNGRQTNWSFAIVNNNSQGYRYPNSPYPYPNNDPYYNNNQTYYPTTDQHPYPNNDPYYDNNQTYYPNQYPNDRNNNSSILEDILPNLLPQLFPQRY